MLPSIILNDIALVLSTLFVFIFPIINFFFWNGVTEFYRKNFNKHHESESDIMKAMIMAWVFFAVVTGLKKFIIFFLKEFS